MSERPPVRTKEYFLVFGSPALEQEEIDEVVACLKSRWIGTGPRTAQFERDFAVDLLVIHQQDARATVFLAQLLLRIGTRIATRLRNVGTPML